jgi:hypothetical protein
MADRDLLDRGGLNAIEPGLTGAARVTIGGKSRKTRGCVVAARRAPTPTTQGPPTGPGTAETEHAATLNTIHQEPARVRPVAVHPGVQSHGDQPTKWVSGRCIPGTVTRPPLVPGENPALPEVGSSPVSSHEGCSARRWRLRQR